MQGDIAHLDDMAITELADWLAVPSDWARSAMVVSLGGAYLDPTGSSRGLSGPVDLRVLRTMRALADVIVVGGNTARSEGYIPGALHPQMRQLADRGPRLAVISRDLHLPDEGPLFAGEHPPIVITEQRDDAAWAAAADRLSSRVHLGVCPTPLTGAWVREHLRSIGLPRLVCEGGPAVQHLMRADGSIDEVCLSVAHGVVGSGTTGVGALGGHASRYALTHVGTSTHHTVLRMSLLRHAPTLVA